MRRRDILRPGFGVLLCLAGLSGITTFPIWQRALGGLSADGVVLPHTWLMLRIMIIALAAPGVLLLTAGRLRTVLGRLQSRLTSLPRRRFLLLGLGAAALARTAWVLGAPLRMYADWATYDDLGWRLATTGELAEATHRTMYRPPGYPFVLSLLYRGFGHAPQAAVALNVLLGVGIVYLAYRLARRIRGEAAARWVVVLLAAFPSQILYINLTCTEPLFTFLFLLALELFLSARARSETALWSFGAAGVVLGLATLVRSLTLTFPVVLVPLLFAGERRRSRAIIRTLALAAGLGVTVAPWVVRNYNLNGLVTISTNGSMVFYIGNNPNASFGFNRPDPEAFAGYSPEAEAEIDRRAWREGWAYIRERPLAFVGRGFLKAAFLMTSDTEGWAFNLHRAAVAGTFGRDAGFALVVQAYYLAFLLLTVVGVRRLFGRGAGPGAGGYLYLLTILYWLAVHFVFFGEGRYHYPIVPVMAGLAAVALTAHAARRGPAEGDG